VVGIPLGDSGGVGLLATAIRHQLGELVGGLRERDRRGAPLLAS
jgi:hypothetical protein